VTLGIKPSLNSKLLKVQMGDCGNLKLSRFLDNGNRKLISFVFRPIIYGLPVMELRKFTARMIDQDTWVSIRHMHYRQGKSKPWLAKEFGISRNTVKKYLRVPDAPQYKTSKARVTDKGLTTPTVGTFVRRRI